MGLRKGFCMGVGQGFRFKLAYFLVSSGVHGASDVIRDYTGSMLVSQSF